MAEIRLLATDLDGTLIGSASDFPLYEGFRDRLEQLRESHNTIWTTCSGRSLSSFKGFFRPMRLMGIQPDFVICDHSYIYQLSRLGFMPHVLWSLRIYYLLALNRLFVRQGLKEWHRMITGGSVGVRTIRRDSRRLRLRFSSEEATAVAAAMIAEKIKDYRGLTVLRGRRDLEVRNVPFTKGLAVSELARHLKLPRESILTIGDGQNDLPMLDTRVAKHIGCPSNAHPEVMKLVHEQGGHISDRATLGGVLDVMDAVRDDRVKSALPDNWREPAESPTSHRRPKSRQHDRKGVRTVLLLVAITYAVMVVFASFGLMPGGGVILKPFRVVLRILERILTAVLGWFY